MEDVKTKTSDLSSAVQKVGAELYKQTDAKKPPEGGETPKPEEGEYKEK